MDKQTPPIVDQTLIGMSGSCDNTVSTTVPTVVSVGVKDHWHSVFIQKAFSADGFLLCLSTTDSRGLPLCDVAIVKVPLLRALFPTLSEGAIEFLKVLPLPVLTFLDRYFSQCDRVWMSPQSLLTLLSFEFPGGCTLNECRRFLCDFDFVDVQSSTAHKTTVHKIVCQTAELTSKQKGRIVRELVQREKAYEKDKVAHRAIPKRTRETDVRRARFLKESARDRVDHQSSYMKLFGKGIYERIYDAMMASTDLTKRMASLPAKAVLAAEQVAAIVETVKNTTDSLNTSGVIESVKTSAGVAGITAMRIGESADISAQQAIRIGDAVTSASDIFTVTIKNLYQNLVSTVPVIYAKCLTACFLVFLFTQFKAKLVRLAIIGVSSLLFGETVYNIFFKNFRLEEDVSGDFIQQESDAPSLMAEVFTTVIAAVALGGYKPPNVESLLAKLASVASTVPRTLKGVDTLVDTVVNLVEKSVNVIRDWCKLKPIRLMRRHSDDIERLVVEILEFEHKIRASTTDMTEPQQYNHLLHLSNSLLIFRKTSGADDRLSREINYLMDKLGRLAEPLKHSVGVAGGARPQPTSVLISGEPGLGKTMMVNNFSLTVMKLTGNIAAGVSAQEASRSIYVKPANSPYMDGYNHQFTMLYDDFLQMKTTPGQEGTEVSDLMTHYGPFTSTLNMADCPKKGMYPFTSKLILMTTNVRNLNQIHLDAMMVEPQALVRRIDHHVRVQVRKEFRVDPTPANVGKQNRLCMVKFAREEAACPPGLNKFPWHIWEYRYTHFGDDADFEPGSGYDMRLLIQDVAEKIRANQDYHQNAMDTYAHLVNGDVSEWNVPDRRPVSQLATERVDQQSGLKFPTLPEELEYDHVSRYDFLSDLPELEPDELTEESLVSRFKAYFDFDWQVVLKPLLLSLTGLTALALVGYALKCAYDSIRDLLGYNTEVNEKQSNARPVRTVRAFKEDVVRHQSGESIPGLWYQVYKNTFKVVITIDSDRTLVLGQLLILANNTFVMPMHFLKDIRQAIDEGQLTTDSEVLFRSCAMHQHTFKQTVRQFLGLSWHFEADRDLAFSDFKNALQPRKDITHFIMKSEFIRDQGTKVTRLDTARASKDGVLLDFNERVSYISPNLEVSNGVSKYIGEPGNGVNHKLWLRYHAETEPGDCGAVLSVTDHAATSCQFVVGLHVGRSRVTGHAYATQLDQETARAALRRFSTRTVFEQSFDSLEQESGWSARGVSCEPIDVLPFNDGESEVFGSFLPYCAVSKGTVAPVSSSLVQTVFGSEKFFSDEIEYLSGGNKPADLEVMKLGGSAMAVALKPFATGTIYVEPEKFRDAVFTAMHPFSTASEHFTARTFTFEEAVVGVPSLGFASIPRSTSLGYPWCLSGRDKSFFFGKGQEYDLTTVRAQALKSEVLSLVELVRQGTRPLFVCRDFLKDEVRKKGKAARLIAGTDVRYYILCRMYFGAFAAALTALHQESGVCLGVNQYAEWSWLKEFITKKGPKVWDGDFAGFDSSQQPQMLWEILHFINAWYTRHGEGEDNEIRRILFMDLVHSRHLVSLKGEATTVVEWVKSLPSGHFLTAIVNSILSMSLIVSAYMGTTGRMDFWTHAGVAAQGDDNLVNASDEVIHQFNQISCSKYLEKEFGMVYTAGRKGEELKAFMGIEDVIFLQRRFAVKDGIDVCPIRPESFLHSLYYTRKQKEAHVLKKDLLTGLENALEELALYPESAWLQTIPKLSEAFKLLDAVPMLDVTTSDSYFQAVLKRVPSY